MSNKKLPIFDGISNFPLVTTTKISITIFYYSFNIFHDRLIYINYSRTILYDNEYRIGVRETIKIFKASLIDILRLFAFEYQLVVNVRIKHITSAQRNES